MVLFSRESAARHLEVVLSVLLVLILLVAGFIQGGDWIAFELSVAFLQLNIAFIEALSSVVGFTVFITFCTFLSFAQIFLQGREKGVSESESITAVVPTYMDSHALERSVPSILETGYPDLQVMIVCEPDDEEAKERCGELSDRFEQVSYTVNEKYPGTKAGAVNYAVEETESDAVAVFDADQEIGKGFLRRSMHLIFEEGRDVVQARIAPRPEDFLETLCYCEALFMYVIPERLADFLTKYSVAGSRGVAMSREVFEELDGYDPDFLTEDMDFAFRCYEQGYDVKPLLSEVSTEEAPHGLRDYWGQRKRWVKGHIQVFESRLRQLFRTPDIRYLKSAAISGFIPIGWFFLILLVSKFLILLILGADLVVLAALGNLTAIAAVFRFMDRDLVEGGWLGLLGASLVFPLYGLVAVKSLFEYIIRRDTGWYMVEKTG